MLWLQFFRQNQGYHRRVFFCYNCTTILKRQILKYMYLANVLKQYLKNFCFEKAVRGIIKKFSPVAALLAVLKNDSMVEHQLALK